MLKFFVHSMNYQMDMQVFFFTWMINFSLGVNLMESIIIEKLYFHQEHETNFFIRSVFCRPLTKCFMRSLKHTNVDQKKFIIPNSQLKRYKIK